MTLLESAVLMKYNITLLESATATYIEYIVCTLIFIFSFADMFFFPGATWNWENTDHPWTSKRYIACNSRKSALQV